MEKVKETVSLKTLVESKAGLDELATLKMNIKMSYAIGKFLGQINTPIQNFFDARNKYIQDHGEKNDKGGFELKDEEALMKLQEDLNELLKEEIEVEVPKIKLDELEKELDDPDPKLRQKISPSTLTNLEWIIIE